MDQSHDSDVLGSVLDRVGAVLVDVGASGKAHAPWQPVARKSIFVGFDPDSRDIDPTLRANYAQYRMVPKIVAGRDAAARTPFFLTAFPQLIFKLSAWSISYQIATNFSEATKPPLLRGGQHRHQAAPTPN